MSCKYYRERMCTHPVPFIGSSGAGAGEPDVAGTDVWTPPRFKNNKGKDPRNSLSRSDGNGIKPTSKLRRLPFRS